MKTNWVMTVRAGGLTLLCACTAVCARPNFVFILSDDQDWTGLSVQMHDSVPNSKSDFYRTPNLERFAAQGMRFSNAYAPSPVCSPTRYSLLTGKSPAQLHWTKAAPVMTASDGHRLLPPRLAQNIDGDEVTVAEMLKQAGYATAHYGKWHLRGRGPDRHGFDEHDGNTGNEDAAPFKDPNPVDIFGITERACAFMEKHSKAGTPFYVQLSHHALHYPENARRKTLEACRAREPGRMHWNVERAAITEDLDAGVGLLLAGIDTLGIAENTYVIYMSDNGGGGKRARPIRGGKGSLWEGGIRVPLIIRGPGVRPGTFCHVPVVGYDLFPTLRELAGVDTPLPSGVEGGSWVPLLHAGDKGSPRPAGAGYGESSPLPCPAEAGRRRMPEKGLPEVVRPREGLVWHFPHYQARETPHSAIRAGNHKLIRFYETGETRLFDLSRDVGEQNDLSRQMPEKAAELIRRLDEYLGSVNAQLPTANPDYDPSKTPRTNPPRRGRRGRREEAGERRRERGGPSGVFRTDVPERSYDLILGRPTGSSVTASVLSSRSCEITIRYGADPNARACATRPMGVQAGKPAEIGLTGLRASTRYQYRVGYRPEGAPQPTFGNVHHFHTARSPGESFTFTITADSHLDENTDPAIYAQTLRNALTDSPDFHVDLGDTFMTGKRQEQPSAALQQYLAQRYYFGLLCHSAPLFLVLGNHDGEFGRNMDAATRMRTAYFPNPVPDVFYAGNRDTQNYYAWHWGDALFVVLDPFRHSQRPRRGEEADNWRFTLGREQYDWVKTTLDRSRAHRKFVFIHHLVGGLDQQGRGGAEAVPFYEWGGRDRDGRDVFAEKRPGWPMPIHALLVKHGVDFVFHGHDHFYAKQEVDGIVYQLLPQPGHPGEGSVRQAAEYGYVSGDMRPGSGYLRVEVSRDGVTVDFIRTGR